VNSIVADRSPFSEFTSQQTQSIFTFSLWSSPRRAPDLFFSAGERRSKLQLVFNGFSFEVQQASLGDLQFASIFHDWQFRIGKFPLLYRTRPLALIYPADFKTPQMGKTGFCIPDPEALNSIDAWGYGSSHWWHVVSLFGHYDNGRYIIFITIHMC
jgi:hypothetical protein